MSRLNWTASRLLAIVILASLAACAGNGHQTGNLAGQQERRQELADPALLATLEQQLLDELQRLGKDPGRESSSPPAGNHNAVFSMQLDALAPDGLGGQGFLHLRFQPRMLGDYDGNGVVGISDITPLGKYFGETVEYDEQGEHGGISYWPAGDPDGEGRDNWLKARVDGDGNGIINAADITTIAIHFGERSNGWRVEQRHDPQGEFSLLPHSSDEDAEYSIDWTDLATDSIGHELQTGWPAGGYTELRVQAWSSTDNAGGPHSATAIYEHPLDDLSAALEVDTSVADFPFTASFTAAGSSAVADSYLLDFGDGEEMQLDSLAHFPVDHTYTGAGIFDAVLTITRDGDEVSDTVQIMATPLPCEIQASLSAMPDRGFAPLKLLFDAAGSDPADGGYSLDFGDGSEPLEASSPAGLAVTHEYSEPGSYTAVLTAYCGNGGSVSSEFIIEVDDPVADCRVNLSVAQDTVEIGSDAQFFFGGTSGSAAVLDFGDGSDNVFVNLQGPEPVLHEYAEPGTYIARMHIVCDEEMLSDSVLVFVVPQAVQDFDVAGNVYQFETNPTLGGPEPDKFALQDVEMVIIDGSSQAVLSTVQTDSEGAYFFDGSAIGLDVTKFYFVRPSDAEKAMRLPLGWFPGQATIILPAAGETHVCTDINLLATAD